MYEIIGKCLALFMLGILSAFDIKNKKIPVVALCGFGVVTIFYVLFEKDLSLVRALLCLSAGIFLLLLAFCTGEKIGYGDGVTVLLLGLLTGGERCVFVLCVAILFSGIYALSRLICKNRETICFLPFLLIGLEVSFFAF